MTPKNFLKKILEYLYEDEPENSTHIVNSHLGDIALLITSVICCGIAIYLSDYAYKFPDLLSYTQVIPSIESASVASIIFLILAGILIVFKFLDKILQNIASVLQMSNKGMEAYLTPNLIIYLICYAIITLLITNICLINYLTTVYMADLGAEFYSDTLPFLINTLAPITLIAVLIFGLAVNISDLVATYIIEKRKKYLEVVI